MKPKLKMNLFFQPNDAQEKLIVNAIIGDTFKQDGCALKKYLLEGVANDISNEIEKCYNLYVNEGNACPICGGDERIETFSGYDVAPEGDGAPIIKDAPCPACFEGE
jgi:RNA polymerase subunit RPABC4/transcription elongation factor Spt4